MHAVYPRVIDANVNKESEWDRPAPDVITKIILDKVEAGELDIVPDEMGFGMFNV